MGYPNDTHGLEFINLLELGSWDLAWMQFALNRKMDRQLLVATGQYGLVIPKTYGNQLDRHWLPTFDVSNGNISFSTAGSLLDVRQPIHDGAAALYLVDQRGRWGVHEGDRVGLTVAKPMETAPDDNTWRTLVVRRVLEKRERGYISVSTGSTTVTGVGTEFTKYLAYTDDALNTPKGAKLRIDAGDSANGNEGVYEIDSITSDTQLELRTAVAGTDESDLPWFIQGDFLGSFSGTPGDGDDRSYERVEAELVTRTTQPATGDLLIGDVKYDTGGSNPAMAFIDKRMNNVLMPSPNRRLSVGLRPPLTLDYLNAQAAVEAFTVTALSPNNDMSAVGRYDGGLMVFYYDGTNLDAEELPRQALDVCLDGTYATAALSTPVPAAAANNPSAIALPVPETGANTHMLVYDDGTKLLVVTSDDDGATWGTPATLYDPTSIDANDTATDPDIVLLNNGRIIVIFAYYDDSTSLTRICWVQSDDYGATWDDNSGASYEWYAAIGRTLDQPTIYQDERGRIHTAWRDDELLADNIYYAASSSRTAMVPSSSLRVRYDGPNNVGLLRPTIWASPDGEPIILFEHKIGTSPNIEVSIGCIRVTSSYQEHPGQPAFVLGFDNPEMLLQNISASATDLTTSFGLSAYQHHGHLWITFIDGANCRLMRLTPFLLPMGNRHRAAADAS